MGPLWFIIILIFIFKKNIFLIVYSFHTILHIYYKQQIYINISKFKDDVLTTEFNYIYIISKLNIKLI